MESARPYIDSLRCLERYNLMENSEYSRHSYVKGNLQRELRIWKNPECASFYTYRTDQELVCYDENKFYRAINIINEDIMTFSVEYYPDQKLMMLKSTIIILPGVDLRKGIEYYELMHNKYYVIIFQNLSNLPENIDKLGISVKEQANKSSN